MYTYLWCFFILSFAGWLGEVAFAAVVEHKFVNRGFLNGPFCPIYGTGAVAMYLVLLPTRDNFVLLFIGSMVIGSAVEWITGFILEKIFHQKWWDYSDIPYNLNGYICLGFSLVWGAAGVLVVHVLMPSLSNLIALIPHTLGLVLLSVIAAVTLADFIITVISITGMQKKLSSLQTLAQGIRSGSDLIGKALSGTVITAKDHYDESELKENVDSITDRTRQEVQELREKYQQALQNLQHNKIHARLMEAFPRVASGLRGEPVQQLQEKLEAISQKSAARLRRREERAAAAYRTELPEGQPKPFAHGVGFVKLFWIFMIGNVIGFIVETLWCVLPPPHNFELRVSVLYGPFVLVYGFGAVLLTLLLRRFHSKSSFVIFLISAVIGGAFEYLCSLIQELLFGSVSWDYSGSIMSVGGRTNILFSFFWGLLGMLWIKDIYPRISLRIEKFPRKAGNIITVIAVILMALDIVLSAAAVSRQGKRLQDLPASNAIEAFLDKHYDDEFLAKRYVNMKFVH